MAAAAGRTVAQNAGLAAGIVALATVMLADPPAGADDQLVPAVPDHRFLVLGVLAEGEVPPAGAGRVAEECGEGQ